MAVVSPLDDLAALVVSEVDALIEDAGDRREPGTVRVLETLRAAVRYLERRPVVESVADAVRVVEDVIDDTSDHNGSAGYYACSCRVTTARTAPAVVEALIGDPVLTQHDDGTVTIAWPNDTAIAALVSREALEAFVAAFSDLGKTVEAIRRTLDGEP